MEIDYDFFYPTSKEEWRAWLVDNHQKKEAIWVIFYKKSAKEPSISWSDAVDEALCFGWIDSLKKTIDEKSYRQFFGPRKPKSIWSKINKDKVALLLKENKMAPAGLAAVEVAKANGMWSMLDEAEALIIPPDLKAAFEINPGTFDFYEGLSKTNKKGLLFWIVMAKRQETRENRIAEIIENANKKQLPKRFRS